MYWFINAFYAYATVNHIMFPNFPDGFKTIFIYFLSQTIFIVMALQTYAGREDLKQEIPK